MVKRSRLSRKFKKGDKVIIYPSFKDLRGTGMVVGYQHPRGYFVRATGGSQLKEFGSRKKLTYYDFELRKARA